MGRMHSRGKGISASVIPYSRTVPSWLKTTAESVEESIVRLSKVRRAMSHSTALDCSILTMLVDIEGRYPSQIGVILRDSHGIAQVKIVTGKCCPPLQEEVRKWKTDNASNR